MPHAPDTHSLMDEVLSRENLTRAWKRVHANKGAPGIDGLRIDEFAAYFRAHGPSVLAALRRGDYRPYPARRTYIEKEDGSLRGLGIPTVFERVLASVTRFVERRLKLNVNEQKSQVVPTSQCKFLWFSFHGCNLVWHRKALDKFKREVRTLTNRSQGKSLATVIRNLSIYLRGWINYFGIAKGFQKCIDLDQWIRRRLRMYLWKRWRRARTRVRYLLALGVPKELLAICCGASGKRYWHSARTEGIHRAISNEYLESQGLISLRDRWVAIHYG